LYVSGGLVLSSAEGVTQGDPLAMVMYGLALLPLIRELRPPDPTDWTQAWYADDGQAVARLKELREWWDLLVEKGPKYGYYPKAVKTLLVVKEGLEKEAEEIFEGTGVKILSGGGSRDLGAAIGSAAFKKKYVGDKVSEWTAQVLCLAGVAKVQPHAAHALLIHGLRHRWTFLQRCMGQVDGVFQELEDVLRNVFIPALFSDGDLISDQSRELFSLPSRYGGLSIDNPTEGVQAKYDDSKELTASSQEAILKGGGVLDMDDLKVTRRKIKNRRENFLKDKSKLLQEGLHEADPLRKAIQVASEKGASGVFAVKPNEEFGFVVKSKRDFRDLLAMRYGKPVRDLPATCACGKEFSINHSQICKKGGFIHQRHDEFEKVWAVNCKKVFKDVQCEPILQDLDGEEMKFKSANKADDARSDVRVRGFWGNKKNAFFDFRVFYPFASSLISKSLASVYKSCGQAKRREYAERVEQVEDGSFTPMVMSSSGGMGPEMSIALKFLAAQISLKENSDYSTTVSVLRCRFSFAAARTALVCLRGSRSLWGNKDFSRKAKDHDAPEELVAAQM
jgi:hypothetical protein